MATSNTAPPDPSLNNTPSHSPASAGRSYTQSEVDDLLTRTRRDEKDKLYADLNKSREKITDLERQVAEHQGTAAQMKVLQDKLAAAEDAHKKLDEAVTNRITEALKKQDEAFEETRRRDKLEAFRGRLLAGLKDAEAEDFVSDLVRGNTEEEIKASFDKAVAKYNKVVESARASKEKELTEKYKGALPPSVQPGSDPNKQADPPPQEGSSTGMKSFLRMKPEERAAKITDLKKTAFADAGLPLSSKD